jgi:ribosomal protein L37E
MGIGDLWRRGQAIETGWSMGWALVLILMGGVVISLGIITWDSWMLTAGATMLLLGLVLFVVMRFVFADLDAGGLSAPCEGLSATNVFGARVYELNDVKCVKCGGGLFDVHADGSGACAKCGQVMVRISVPDGQKPMGTRNSDGSIEPWN